MLSVKIHGWLVRTLRSPITLSFTAKTFGVPWGNNWVYTKYVYLSFFDIYFAPNLQVLVQQSQNKRSFYSLV